MIQAGETSPASRGAKPECGCAKTKKTTLTRAQKLTKALKACKKKAKAKRATCEKQARKHYAPLTKKRTKKKP